MITRNRVKELAKIAGFEVSHEGDDYVCFIYKEELTNPHKIILGFDKIISTSYVETEEDVLSKLFEETQRIGRMQVRQQLVKIINIFNVE